jgi:hypothetical protein
MASWSETRFVLVDNTDGYRSEAWLEARPYGVDGCLSSIAVLRVKMDKPACCVDEQLALDQDTLHGLQRDIRRVLREVNRV